jgi:hypothetical protein
MPPASALLGMVLMCSLGSTGFSEAAAGGASWVIQQTPNDGDHVGSNDLYGVACVTATRCFGVGGYNGPDDTGDLPIAMAWDGSSRSMSNVQSPKGKLPELYSVSCLSATDCVAVGSYEAGRKKQLPLAEHWDGSAWTIVPVPNPKGSRATGLFGVACVPAAGTCMAVGSFSKKHKDRTLAEHWDGSAWTIVPSANPPKGPAQLLGVSCTADAACSAVGDTTKSSAFAERWNGSNWTMESVAKPSGATTYSLTGVACSTPTSCIAAGRYATKSAPQLPLAEEWNGSGWSVLATPVPPGAEFTFLQGVECQSPSSCIAVGGSSQSGPEYAPLAEAWNGSSWTIQDTPTRGIQTWLAAISCTSSTKCTAVGTSGIPFETLAERYS